MIKVYKYEDLPANLLEEQSSHLFYGPSWLSVLQRQYGCSYYATADEETGAIMLFALIKCLAGKKLVSLPFSDYTRPELHTAEELPEHIEVLREAFPGLPVCLKINYKERVDMPSPALGDPIGMASLHRVATGREVSLDRKMYSSFKRGMRKACARGLSFETNCSREGLEQFYELFYALRMQKHGLIPQPFAFFEGVYDEFISQEKGFFAEVRKKGKLLASAVVLRHKNGLYYKWGCSAIEDLRDRPNNLLFYELLHLAQRDGFDFVDLGLSDLDANRGLIRFKRSMGGEESDIFSYQFLPKDYPCDTIDQFKGIVNSIASIVVASHFDRKTTESFSQTLYPLFA